MDVSLVRTVSSFHLNGTCRQYPKRTINKSLDRPKIRSKINAITRFRSKTMWKTLPVACVLCFWCFSEFLEAVLNADFLLNGRASPYHVQRTWKLEIIFDHIFKSMQTHIIHFRYPVSEQNETWHSPARAYLVSKKALCVLRHQFTIHHY